MVKYINNQKYCDCSFITLINATIFWDKVQLLPYTKRYNKLAADAGCIYGSCLNLNEVYTLLNITTVKGKMNLKWIRTHLPVSFSIFCHRGFHSVLCVAVKNNKLCLTNYYRNKLKWVEWCKIKKIQCKRLKPKQILIIQ